MVESYVMIRTQTNADGTYGPREEDIAPYTVSGEDVTARAFDVQGPLFLDTLQTDPQVGVWRYRMSNADALAMQSDNKLWMLASKRYTIEEDGTRTEVDSDWQQPYTAEERTLRINQLGNFTDFDVDTISAWWTVDKTHVEVATKMRNYLRTLNA